MSAIRIDEGFRSLIPALSLDERAQLEHNLVQDGCRDPLVVWNGTLLDGHNRYEICTAKGIEFRTVAMDFATRDDAKYWIIRNQFGRRNLTSFQRAELALLLEPLFAAKAKENQVAASRENLKRGDSVPVRQTSDKPGRHAETLKEIAKIAGVSHDTIHKAKVILDKGPAALQAAVRNGEQTINSAYQEVRPPSTRKKSAVTHATKPDFRVISKHAVQPTRGHGDSVHIVAVNLPKDPAKAATVLVSVFDATFIQELATALVAMSGRENV